MTYQHTQSKPHLAVVLLVVAVVTAGLAIAFREPALIVGPAVLLGVAVLGYALSAITATVTTESTEAAFRWGRPRRVIPHEQVIGVEVVRNRWWYGWGIRWFPGGTLYSVWGLDAVHLELDGRRNVRIGTDDPSGLAAAIEAARDRAH